MFGNSIYKIAFSTKRTTFKTELEYDKTDVYSIITDKRKKNEKEKKNMET